MFIPTIKKGVMLVAGVIACLTAGAAYAQYPDKPIRVVVPFPAGGGTDIVGRTVLNRLSEELGQPIIVDNRAGAGTQIGTKAVADALPDGYTLLYTSSAFSANPSLSDNVQYDPQRSFDPIALAAFHPFVLLAPTDRSFSSVAELIEQAKAKPGELTYASVGVGSSQHLGMELFKRMAGVDILHVPYGGSAPAMQDLLGGRVDLMFNGISPSLAHIQSGRLKALATDSDRRVPLLPDVPTVAESGLEGYAITTWSGLLGPAGLPADVLNRLESAMQVVLADPKVQADLEGRGLIPAQMGAKEFKAFLTEDEAEWRRLIEDSGARAELAAN